METISEFLKDQLPQLVLDNMATILEEALKMELGNKLQIYETEYYLMEELTSSFHIDEEAQDLKSLNACIRRQNRELIEQLAFHRGLICQLASTVETLQDRLKEQQIKLEKWAITLSLSLSPSLPPSLSNSFANGVIKYVQSMHVKLCNHFTHTDLKLDKRPHPFLLLHLVIAECQYVSDCSIMSTRVHLQNPFCVLQHLSPLHLMTFYASCLEFKSFTFIHTSRHSILCVF